MTLPRRVIPLALVGVLVVLTAVAAIVEVRGAPSEAQVTLENAVAKTMGASSFEVRQIVNGEYAGTWEAPDRLFFFLTESGGASFLFLGKQEYVVVSRPHAQVLHRDIRVDSPDTFSTVFDFDTPLPPLGEAATASNVVRVSDGFSFIVPTIRVQSVSLVGPVIIQHPVLTAYNTPMAVEVRNGFVVALTLTRGISVTKPDAPGALRRAHRPPETWHLSHFNDAPPVVAPKLG